MDREQRVDGESETEPHYEDPVPLIKSTRAVQYRKLPLGMWVLEKTGILNFKPLISHKTLVFILTYICYASYYLSRKPFSVVKVVLCPECGGCNTSNVTEPGWEPFNANGTGNILLGTVDYSWLFAYAIALFISGQIADRVNLRYFLLFGMIGSAVSAALLSVAYFANIRMLWYFIVVQVFSGAMQSTGAPGTVAVMSHWFGKQNRGLIMGVWNSHTSVGSILGTIIPSFWADCEGDGDPWGWSFVVPACITAGAGILIFLMLVVNPQHVGLKPPKHHDDQEEPVPPAPVITNGYPAAANGTEPDSDDKDDKEKEDRLRERDMLDKSGAQNFIQSSTAATTAKVHPKPKSKAISILRAFLIPGVIEFSLALFFNKLVSYTFLYWLPLYVKYSLTHLSGPESDWLSTLFDVGGILGGITAGVVSDRLKARAITCVVMLLLAIPSLFVLEEFGKSSIGLFTVMLIISGMFVTGPYAMITTAVSSDLSTHKSLQNNQNAKATVTAIINGTGSLGAAFGPLLVGWITGAADWLAAFYMLMASCCVSALLLSRLMVKDVISMYRRISHRCSGSCPVVRRRPLLEETPNITLTALKQS